MQNSNSDQVIAAQQHQLIRAQTLMTRLLPEAARIDAAHPVDIEVLEPARTSADVQTNALLNSYASSLSRAKSLLKRAVRS